MTQEATPLFIQLPFFGRGVGEVDRDVFETAINMLKLS